MKKERRLKSGLGLPPEARLFEQAQEGWQDSLELLSNELALVDFQADIVQYLPGTGPFVLESEVRNIVFLFCREMSFLKKICSPRGHIKRLAAHGMALFGKLNGLN